MSTNGLSFILLTGLVCFLLLPIGLVVHFWRKSMKETSSKKEKQVFYLVELLQCDAHKKLPSSRSTIHLSPSACANHWKSKTSLVYSTKLPLCENTTQELNKILFCAQDQLRLCPKEHWYYMPTCKSLQLHSESVKDLHHKIHSHLDKNQSVMLHVTSSDMDDSY